MKRNTIIPLVGLILLFATPAFALDMEFYTYGGFNPIVQAFNKIALIFSDSGYQGLLFVVMVLGIIAGAGAWIAKAVTGARVIPLVWTVPVIFGAVLYLALFIPTGNITVYDPVMNRFQTIGGVPDAIVFTAGFLNKIERGMVDIIDTAAAPSTEYQTTAGGIGFKVLKSVKGSYPKNNYASTSMVRYIKDCVTFELVRPGTTLSLDDLRNNTSDFLDDLGKAVNPSVFTVYYDAVNPEGTTMSCTDAWSNLRPIYANPNNYDEALKKICSKAYFDPSSAVEMNTCKSLLANTLNFTTGSVATPEKLIQQRMIAEMLYNFYFKGDAETAALMESNKRITSTGLGIGLTMNEWIPIMRAIMTAIAIGIIPFLVLFLPTPVMGKAISVMFGFFVFLTTWGITDAVIHGAAMDYASYAFEDMRQSNLGVYAMAALPTISLKMLAMFGVIRSAGIMLASFFSMMLIRFGGHALAMLAGNLSSIVQSAGAQAGRNFTPEGTGAALNEQVRAAGLLEGLPEHRFSNMAAAGAFSLHKNVGGYNAAMKAKAAQIAAGQLPPDTSDVDMAESMASGGIKIGTSTGTSSTSLGPDGKGMTTDTVAGGSATYSVGNRGQHSLTRATINNVDPVRMAEMKSHQSIVSASNSLGSSQTWQQAMDTARRASQTNSDAYGFTSRLDNAMRENWARAMNSKSSFTHSMSEDTRNILTAAVSSGKIPFLSRVGGQAQLSVIGSDGESVSFDVSEDVARRFENTASRVRSESMTETLQDSKSLDYMTKLAKQVGASEAYSFLNDAREIKGSSTSYGIDVMTGLVDSYAINRYGTNSPENIRSAINALNDMVTNQGIQGKQNFNDIASSYISNQGFFSNTTPSVHGAMRANRALAKGPAGFKHDVGMSAMDAGSKTFGIDEGSFHTPTSDVPLDNPNAKAVIDPADAIHRRTHLEESGKGGIHSTAGGIAKEMAGLDKHQPVRPTSDLYQNDAFYNEGSLVGPQQREDGGIVLPSGMVIRGDANYTAPSGKDWLKGSVFEKK